MKNLLIILSIFCISITANSQIDNEPIREIVLTDTSSVLDLTLLSADEAILELITAAEEGTYKITMTSLTLTKYVSSYSSYIGSTSYSTSSSSNKYFNFIKNDEFTAEGSFFVNGTRAAANVKIYTTKLGGQKMTIRHTEGVNTDVINITNLSISKKGEARFVITGDSEKDGTITNYIVHIFRNVIQ